MEPLLLPLAALGAPGARADDVRRAGGKAANLGALMRIDGVVVPTGWCVTTSAFEAVALADPHVADAVARLARRGNRPRDAGDVRRAIRAVPLPAPLVEAIGVAVATLGDGDPTARFAVRSSATAEDRGSASFAGLYDSFLDVAASDVASAVSDCWSSLFTDRAVDYRNRHGIDEATVTMAVVVQPMVAATTSGVMFTADPVTSNRRVVVIEAVHGTADRFVSGHASAQRIALHASDDMNSDDMNADGAVVIDERRARRLAAIGRRIELHMGRPQDIEWCATEDTLVVVQSRPITTLFPIPDNPAPGLRVYLSVGHQQMMTDALRPLGLSIRQQTSMRPMFVAAGRQFVDIADELASPVLQARMLSLGRHDPLTGDALRHLVERGSVTRYDSPTESDTAGEPPSPPTVDPSLIGELVAENEASVDALRRGMAAARETGGAAVLDTIENDFPELRRLLADPRVNQALMAGMNAGAWLNDRLQVWLGESNPSGSLSLAVPGNVTAEMGLTLFDVADAIRPHADVVARLRRVGQDDTFLAGLADLPGGASAAHAFTAFLTRFGTRCPAEIDVSKPRWRERPSALVPSVLALVDHAQHGEHARRLATGESVAAAKTADILARLRALPDRVERADDTARMIEQLRQFTGFREYPKFGIVSRYAVYREALLGLADALVTESIIADRDDIWYLSWSELRSVVDHRHVDRSLIEARRVEFDWFETLTPPRVMTSDGEVIAGSYRGRHVPAGALSGLAVSSGVAEGRARVVVSLHDAALAPGDILVTPHTDPGWTPALLAASGLVTEVGGLMTHGAVIAREYGIAAVVGVDGATTRIRDGQRIRVDGTNGFVELLD